MLSITCVYIIYFLMNIGSKLIEKDIQWLYVVPVWCSGGAHNAHIWLYCNYNQFSISPVGTEGNTDHTRDLTRPWIIRTVMAHIYLEMVQPQPSPGLADLAEDQWEPSVARCPGLSWRLNLNFLFSIKISTCSSSLRSLFYTSHLHLNISAPLIRFVWPPILAGPLRLSLTHITNRNCFWISCVLFWAPRHYREGRPGSDVISVIIIHSNVLLSRCPPLTQSDWKG